MTKLRLHHTPLSPSPHPPCSIPSQNPLPSKKLFQSVPITESPASIKIFSKNKTPKIKSNVWNLRLSQLKL
jgi:hypothetical protein